jgi:hypothetical protein
MRCGSSYIDRRLTYSEVPYTQAVFKKITLHSKLQTRLSGGMTVDMIDAHVFPEKSSWIGKLQVVDCQGPDPRTRSRNNKFAKLRSQIKGHPSTRSQVH